MKKYFIMLSMIGITVLSGCGSSSLTIQEYNDSLVQYTDECIQPTQDLWLDFNPKTVPVDSLLDSLNTCIDNCKTSKSKVSDLGNFQSDSSLKDAVIEILDTYIEYLETFAKTSKYRTLEEMLEEEKEEYQSLSNEIESMISLLKSQTANLNSIQKVFAEKYGLPLYSN